MILALAKYGMIPVEFRKQIEKYDFSQRDNMKRMLYEVREKGDLRHLLMGLREDISSKDWDVFLRDLEHWILQTLDRHRIVKIV